mmetsp:Transcript_26043/g.58975  ORF Transcript_26043/g.58975 Transcript_26043/m.58975 type:complete len:206 (-) Transcript_26043:124-741(-)
MCAHRRCLNPSARNLVLGHAGAGDREGAGGLQDDKHRLRDGGRQQVEDEDEDEDERTAHDTRQSRKKWNDFPCSCFSLYIAQCSVLLSQPPQSSSQASPELPANSLGPSFVSCEISGSTASSTSLSEQHRQRDVFAHRRRSQDEPSWKREGWKREGWKKPAEGAPPSSSSARRVSLRPPSGSGGEGGCSRYHARTRPARRPRPPH